jgi:APA family basic amino acid/polyamine antiporter
MRKRNPEAPRPFKTPLVPFVPILGALVCLLMIAGLGIDNWLRLGVWLIIGFVIYFGYSIKHSKARHENVQIPQDPKPKMPV